MDLREAKKRAYKVAAELLKEPPLVLFKGADRIGDHQRLLEEWESIVEMLERRSSIRPRER